ncbi:MAG: SBBP repeat-containing protein [bacterium]|nr:SBBP repeat-containing protein [bacterium]
MELKKSALRVFLLSMLFVLPIQLCSQIWVARYNGPDNITGFNDDYARAIALDGNGNIYVTGLSGNSVTHDDYATIKYNSSGDTMWVRRYNGQADSNDWAHSIAIDGIGNIYVTGGSQGSGTSFDYATVKYTTSGDTMWCRRYNGLNNKWDEAIGIALDGDRSVYVTGTSVGSGNQTM